MSKFPEVEVDEDWSNRVSVKNTDEELVRCTDVYDPATDRYSHNEDEVARRIAAALNATRHMTTEELERMAEAVGEAKE